MKPGPKKKDSKLNDLHGNPGKKKAAKKPAFKADAATFGIPSGLPIVVRRKIALAVKYLEDNQLSKDSDRLAFDRYCQHVHMAHMAYQDIKKKGMLVKGTLGGLVKNPAVQQHKENSLAALRYEEHFGLTPLSRGKITPEPKSETKDPLADFMSKGGKPYVAK